MVCWAHDFMVAYQFNSMLARGGSTWFHLVVVVVVVALLSLCCCSFLRISSPSNPGSGTLGRPRPISDGLADDGKDSRRQSCGVMLARPLRHGTAATEDELRRPQYGPRGRLAGILHTARQGLERSWSTHGTQYRQIERRQRQCAYGEDTPHRLRVRAPM